MTGTGRNEHARRQKENHGHFAGIVPDSDIGYTGKLCCSRRGDLYFCDACRTGDAPDLPVLPKTKPPKQVPYAVLLIRSADRVLMRLRTERLLQGLWCFPMFEGEFSADSLEQFCRKKLRLETGSLTDAGSARHVFTHQVWQMRIYKTDAAASAAAPSGYEFIPVEKVKDLPLPVAMSAAVEILMRQA